MIHYRTDEEVELVRKSSLLVGKTLAEVAKNLKPGVTGLNLDELAEEFIRDHGGVPTFKNYEGYPYSICFSVNSQVVHGFPTNQEIKDGDLVSVDCGVYMNGFHGDSAYTFAVGEVSDQVLKLMKVTQECLDKAIEQAIEGKRIGDIGFAVQSHAELNGFSVVRELVGHGLGRSLHEAPEVPNYGKRGNGPSLKNGMVLAIEPMINMGKREVKTLSDGWTVVTKDGLPSAHYEHDIVVRKDKAEVLSTFEFIEEAIKQNINLKVTK
jgi:methionyl aminopeptidase